MNAEPTPRSALVKTIVQPTIETCKWDSPTRFDLDDAAAAPARGR